MASNTNIPDDAGSNSSEITNPFAKPAYRLVGRNNTLVELNNPLITITPPRPTPRSALTYTPGMDFTPRAAASNAVAPHVEYASTAAGMNPYMSGPSAVRTDYSPNMGYTNPSSSAGTYLMPPSTHGRAGNQPRQYHRRGLRSNAARSARSRARTQAYIARREAEAALQAEPQAEPPALSDAAKQRQHTLELLRLHQESKKLNLEAYKRHSADFRQLRAQCDLMWASPDANLRLREIYKMEENLLDLKEGVEGFGRRFKEAEELIEELFGQLVQGPDELEGAL